MSWSTLLYKGRRAAQNWNYARNKEPAKARRMKAPKMPRIAGKRASKALMSKRELANDIRDSSRSVLNVKLR